MGLHNTSMCHVGMNRESMKKAVLQNLAIGQQYRVKSTSATQHEGGKVVKCRLTELCKNMAVFTHKNGTTESFIYPELWIQMMNGTLV